MVDGQGGTKLDQGKLRWDLLPPEFEEVIRVLTFGATKYEDRNWEKGIKYGRLIAASFRHVVAWMRGERADPESGIHHLAHAICCLMFLLTYERRQMVSFDDRPPVIQNGGYLWERKEQMDPVDYSCRYTGDWPETVKYLKVEEGSGQLAPVELMRMNAKGEVSFRGELGNLGLG